MSEVKVNKISPRTACGTVTLGDSGDTFTIPSGATITNAGTASGFGATGEISWDTTVKTTGTFTPTAGVGYFLNTTGGIITVNLPAGTAGDSVAMVDYARTWDTNAVTVNANGTEKIGGVASAPATLDTEGQSVTFVYIDGTQGWVNVLDSTSAVKGNPYIVATGGTISCSGNDKIHTFTGPGTFTVCAAAVCAADNAVAYMVVAAGGGAGYQSTGGGGAGGFREGTTAPIVPYSASPLVAATGSTVSASPGSYAIVVGGGGAGATSGPGTGTQGNTSSGLCISSAGGGGGGSDGSQCGSAGGSGGGGANGGSGGAGDTPNVTPDQGFDGGTSTACSPSGAGGGGATVAGTANSGPTGGAGGAGATTSINATPTAYSGGGGGGSRPGSPPGAAGGAGGGGAGGTCCETGADGTPNTGGGGGSGRSSGTGCCAPGRAGGDGIVIIRYRFQ